jgi:hypothetical protein
MDFQVSSGFTFQFGSLFTFFFYGGNIFTYLDLLPSIKYISTFFGRPWKPYFTIVFRHRQCVEPKKMVGVEAIPKFMHIVLCRV